jgi:hypothetical protein
MSEPIPFAGWVDVDDDIQETLRLLTGTDPENMPKYIVLGDGTTYFYRKEEQRYALCEQTPPVQEGIPTTESSGRATNEERS